MDARSFPRVVLIVVACVITLASTGAVAASQSRRLVVFGDSLTDPGNAFVVLHQVSVPPYQLIPDAPYARGGLHFSNGPTWIEQLAKEQRWRGACAALLVPRVCSNYAVGGARARAGAAFDLSSQIDDFLGDVSGAAPAQALYLVHIGGNDLRDAIEALLVDPTGATSVAIIGDALDAMAGNIVTLAAAGAGEFMVPNAPNLALAPAIRLQGPAAQAAAQALSIVFNDALAGLLATLEAGLGVTIHRFDVFALINETVALPAAAGFIEVEAPCITPGVIRHAECNHPDQFLFWDGIHPTRAGHALLAQRAQAILSAP